jgi:phosphoribosylformylglycinamidine cyclo-ligase
VGVVRGDALPEGDFEQGAKGVDGGAVRLVGSYADGAN